MQGDFSVLSFDPYQHKRGVQPKRNGVLRNVNGVLHQQGRVTLDADLTEGELLDLGWQSQAAQDIIGARVAAVPANEPDGFRVDAAHRQRQRRHPAGAPRPGVGGRHPDAAGR